MLRRCQRGSSLLRLLWQRAAAASNPDALPATNNWSPSCAGAAPAALQHPSFPYSTASTAAAAAGSLAAADAAGGASTIPLLACLLAHGVTPALLGHAFWADPRHSSKSMTWVQGELEPKLAALEAEGLGPQQVARFLRQPAPLPCPAPGFLANLGALRALLAPIGSEQVAASAAYTAGLSVVGLLVVRSPACLGTYVGRPPGSLAASTAWLEGQLGIDNAQLAGMVFRRPCILTVTLGPQLLDVLAVLDGLGAAASRSSAGAASGGTTVGWGRRLLELDPLVLTYSLPDVEANLAALREAGYSAAEVCSALEEAANLLVLDLASAPQTRRLLAWARAESGWALADFAREPKYLAADPARSAPRLAFLHQQGLTLPPVPDRNLLLSTDATFCRWAGGLLGRELGVGEWERWLAEWRATPGGQRWGPQEA